MPSSRCIHTERTGALGYGCVTVQCLAAYLLRQLADGEPTPLPGCERALTAMGAAGLAILHNPATARLTAKGRNWLAAEARRAELAACGIALPAGPVKPVRRRRA